MPKICNKTCPLRPLHLTVSMHSKERIEIKSPETPRNVGNYRYSYSARLEFVLLATTIDYVPRIGNMRFHVVPCIVATSLAMGLVR